MAVEQLQPGPNGWSKWSVWPKKVRHICCHCLNTHDIEIKVDKRLNVNMRWKENKKATSRARSIWEPAKRIIWQKFFT